MCGMTKNQLTYSDEKVRAGKLASGLRRLGGLVSEIPELHARSADLQKEAQGVEEDRFRIVVAGSFNRGKSTLLNAMTGRPLVPTEAVPSTAIITLLRYHPTEQVTVYFKDEAAQAESLSVPDFKAKYVLPIVEEIESQFADDSDDLDDEEREQRRIEAAQDAFSHIDYAAVGIPCDLFGQGVEVIDTPGFQNNRTETERARAFLEKSDAVIFLLDATKLMEDDDTKTLDWIISRGQRTIFFVINKWNLLANMAATPAERVKAERLVDQRSRSKLSKYLAAPGSGGYEARVFKINALGAYQARTAETLDSGELQQSNVPAFERALERFLVEGRVQARDHALVSKARNFCAEVDRVFADRLRLRQRGLAELVAAQEALAPKLEQLRGVRRHIEDFLDSHTIRVQKMLAESLATHMANVDVHNIVSNQLNLSVITDTWLALAGLTDLAKKAAAWTRLRKKDDSELFAGKVRKSLTPQIEEVVKGEVRQWQASTAGLQIKDEGRKLVAYLKEEAADYGRILSEIGDIFQTEDHEPIDVEQMVKGWVTGTITDGGVRPPSIDVAGLAIDLAPMMGAIAVDLGLHLTGLALPVIGTVVTIALQFWRQASMADKIKAGIERSLHESLAKIPSAEQRQAIDQEVAKRFNALKETVLTNINAQIASIQLSLDAAIAEVEQGTFDADAERERLTALQTAAHAELAALEEACGV